MAWNNSYRIKINDSYADQRAAQNRLTIAVNAFCKQEKETDNFLEKFFLFIMMSSNYHPIS
jgi:hypothetical protein